MFTTLLPFLPSFLLVEPLSTPKGTKEGQQDSLPALLDLAREKRNGGERLRKTVWESKTTTAYEMEERKGGMVEV
jgi:hypothetical protein